MSHWYDKLIFKNMLNSLETNGHPFPYYLDESTFNFRGVKGNAWFLFNVSMIFSASHLGLFSLPLSRKKDARLMKIY